MEKYTGGMLGGNFFLKNLRLRENLLLATFTVGLVFLLFNLDRLSVWAKGVFSILAPFILGFVLAYLLGRPYRFFRERVWRPLLSRVRQKAPPKEGLVKGLALVTTYLALVLGLAAFFSIIIPQLVNSILTLVEGMPGYLVSFEKMTTEFLTQYSLDSALFDWINEYWTQLLDAFTRFISNLAPVLMNTAMGITSGVVNVFVGIVVSVYMLIGSEDLCAQCKRTLFALLPQRVAEYLLRVVHMADHIFGSFIGGQMTVSLILGTLCAISMTILKMPYALLSGAIIGVTNMIPYFGPFIGAIPSTFIILVESPMKALWFVLLIVVLQQVDNNFISPRIVGSSVGLSGLWVLFAITVGGSLFGIPGMVVGLPTFAVLYTLVGEYIQSRLEKKNLTDQLPPAS